MATFIICIAALFASLLTFFSGFGLGTILTPVFAVFFPIEIAISLTAVIHLLNNIFKLFLVGITKERDIIFRFGIPSMIASFIGAWTLSKLAVNGIIFEYSLGTLVLSTSPIRFCIGLLIILFTLLELIPRFKSIHFDRKYLSIGGWISGYFGGLSGNQGALRSMFLIKSGLSKESFIATGVFIACMVDVARIPIYSTSFFNKNLWEYKWLLISTVISAFTGAYLGSILFKKITFAFLQIIVSIALILVGLLIGFGFI